MGNAYVDAIRSAFGGPHEIAWAHPTRREGRGLGRGEAAVAPSHSSHLCRQF